MKNLNFEKYERKGLCRYAARIPEDTLIACEPEALRLLDGLGLGTSRAVVSGVQFKHSADTLPQAGDYIVSPTPHDFYHVRKDVFERENSLFVVPPPIRK